MVLSSDRKNGLNFPTALKISSLDVYKIKPLKCVHIIKQKNKNKRKQGKK